MIQSKKERRPIAVHAPHTLTEIIGLRLREIRETNRKRQEELALVAREKWGLKWTRATVAAIETAKRNLMVEEFLLLPSVLGSAGCMMRDSEFPRDIALQDLLAEKCWIYVTPEVWVNSTVLKSLLDNSVRQIKAASPDVIFRYGKAERKLREVSIRSAEFAEKCHRIGPIWKRIWPEVWKSKMIFTLPFEKQIRDVDNEAAGDAVRKAAIKLHVSPIAIAIAARKLWDKSLAGERDYRISEQLHGDESPQTIQALRGHVTRELLKELKPILEKVKKQK